MATCTFTKLLHRHGSLILIFQSDVIFFDKTALMRSDLFLASQTKARKCVYKIHKFIKFRSKLAIFIQVFGPNRR